MSAILSAEDLNDFISPGVACIKPVETLPLQKPQDVQVCNVCQTYVLLGDNSYTCSMRMRLRPKTLSPSKTTPRRRSR